MCYRIGAAPSSVSSVVQEDALLPYSTVQIYYHLQYQTLVVLCIWPLLVFGGYVHMATMYLCKCHNNSVRYKYSLVASLATAHVMSPTRHERLGKLVCSSSRARHEFTGQAGSVPPRIQGVLGTKSTLL